jgi:hypothetical protein
MRSVLAKRGGLWAPAVYQRPCLILEYDKHFAGNVWHFGGKRADREAVWYRVLRAMTGGYQGAQCAFLPPCPHWLSRSERRENSSSPPRTRLTTRPPIPNATQWPASLPQGVAIERCAGRNWDTLLRVRLIASLPIFYHARSPSSFCALCLCATANPWCIANICLCRIPCRVFHFRLQCQVGQPCWGSCALATSTDSGM